jgi:hypothetical protein
MRESKARDAIMTKQDYYMFADDYYQRLAEGSDMSVESTGSIPMSMSNGGRQQYGIKQLCANKTH